MTVRDHSRPTLAVLTVCAAAALFTACLLGPTPIPARAFLAALSGAGDADVALILWEIRLPRALAAFTVGMALGTSGCVLQGLLRNPLAEPGVLGVSAASSLFATIAIYWGLVSFSVWVLPAAAIAGALLATALLSILAPRVGSVTTLVLIGVGLSSFAGALMALLLNLAPNPLSLTEMLNWTLGSVANRSFLDLALAAPFWIAGMTLLAFAAPGLRVMALGEEAAGAVGLDVRRFRIITVVGAGLATGAAVSVAGAIGFVGIVAPHLVRPLVGHDPARAVPASALLGGVVLVLADIAARLTPTGQELKLGVVAALLGAPVFVLIAARRRALEAAA